MKSSERVELLRMALIWAMSENASARKDRGKWKFRDGGCGCCSGDTEPPEELLGIIVETLELDSQKSRGADHE